MIKIYHNPRCSKSRAGLKYLEDKNLELEIVKYLETPISVEELKDLIKKLGYENPLNLVRVNEQLWKDNFKGKSLADDEVINAMVENPKLIERPIVVNGDKAVVARPTENIEKLLK